MFAPVINYQPMENSKEQAVDFRNAMKRDQDRIGIIRSLFYQIETRTTEETGAMESLMRAMEGRFNNDTVRSYIVENGDEQLAFALQDWIKSENVDYLYQYRYDDSTFVGFHLRCPGHKPMNEGIFSKFKSKFQYEINLFEEDGREYYTYHVIDLK